MVCPECFTGVVKDETPTGKVVKLYGRDTYFADPPDGAAPKGIILFIPDAFGWEFVNNRLLVDSYAKKGGFRVLLPDFMDGHAAPVSMIKTLDNVMKTDSIGAWITKPYHIASTLYSFIPFMTYNKYDPSMKKVTTYISALRADPAAVSLPLGAAGFCWGGKLAINLTHAAPTPLIDAAFAGHPSGVDFPGEIEKISAPVSVAIGDKDIVMSMKQVKQVQDIFENDAAKKATCEIVVYPGAGHGFTVRADIGNEKVREQATESEEQALNWFVHHFKKEKL